MHEAAPLDHLYIDPTNSPSYTNRKVEKDNIKMKYTHFVDFENMKYLDALDRLQRVNLTWSVIYTLETF